MAEQTSNMKLTQRDHNQIVAHEHNEEFNAKRVYVVNDQVQSDKTPIQVHCNFERIEVPTIIKEYELKEIEKTIFLTEKDVQIHRIEIPVIIKEIEFRDIVREITLVEKEIERIEVPVIVKEIQIERVEVPIVITKTEIQIIEKPVIIRETEYKDLPKWIRICLVSQIIISIIMTLKK